MFMQRFHRVNIDIKVGSFGYMNQKINPQRSCQVRKRDAKWSSAANFAVVSSFLKELVIKVLNQFDNFVQNQRFISIFGAEKFLNTCLTNILS